MISTPVLEGRDLVKSFSVKQGRSPLARKRVDPEGVDGNGRPGHEPGEL